MPNLDPYFIDFEASGLDLISSYPIEVGFCDKDGNGNQYLIKPAALWTHWDIDSQKIHGIKKSELHSNGFDPFFIADILNQKLNGKIVYCDGRQYDAFWLDRLFDAANKTPDFQLGDYSQFIQQEILHLPISVAKKQNKWKAFVGEYHSKKEEIAHRALADCRRLARIFTTHCR